MVHCTSLLLKRLKFCFCIESFQSRLSYTAPFDFCSYCQLNLKCTSIMQARGAIMVASSPEILTRISKVIYTCDSPYLFLILFKSLLESRAILCLECGSLFSSES